MARKYPSYRRTNIVSVVQTQRRGINLLQNLMKAVICSGVSEKLPCRDVTRPEHLLTLVRVAETRDA